MANKLNANYITSKGIRFMRTQKYYCQGRIEANLECNNDRSVTYQPKNKTPITSIS